MRRSCSAVLISVLTVASLALGAAPASAAPPSNDTIAGATVINALPFADSVDTTEATTDADELAAAQPCLAIGAPAIEKAVWYAYTAPAAISILVDVTASTYTAGVAAYAGSPSAGTFMTCAPGTLVSPVATGQTVYLMVFGDQPGSAGGTLRVSVTEAPPLPVVTLSVDPIGQFDAIAGTATITGTATCTGIASFAAISGQLGQTVGRFTVTGYFFAPLICDGTTQAWSTLVSPTNGKFAGGPATAAAAAFACGPVGCGEAFVQQRVLLRR